MGSSASTAYLILYNAACCGGWATILFLGLSYVVESVTSGTPPLDALASMYSAEGLGAALTVVQSAALLEIVHAAVGMVRSPVSFTALQVASRIAALFSIVNSPLAQTQFGAGFMILSWALVEVPRYAFYMAALITGDATKKTPYPLFWLRYSLFAVLYPTGIFGELTVFHASSKDPEFLGYLGDGNESLMYYFVMSNFPIYFLFAIPMIINMAANRKSAFKKRYARPPPPPKGLVWPVTKVKEDGKEERSSTPTAKAILGAAIGAVNPELGEKVVKMKNWRFGYVKPLVAMVNEQCASPEAALAVATAGLDKAYDSFQFIEGDKTMTFMEALEAKTTSKFCTGYVKGEKPKSTNRLEVPYNGKTLYGDELKEQAKKWVEYGTIEPSAGEAICKCVDNPGWLDLSEKYFVLLGAGSAMGPFLVLMALGANVVAIDLDRPNIWKRLIGIAKKSSGSITFPMKVEQSSCGSDDDMYAQSGCNLFTETPKIKDWLQDLYPGKPFTVGSYAYLNGALHVQVSLAMDAICKCLSENRPNTSLAYLCTPTDYHLVPKEAHDASEEFFKDYCTRPFCILMNLLSGGKFLRKNARKPIKSADGANTYYAVNGLSVAQGPNYAMAKRMQHWRAIIARSKGCVVSTNIAPATSTVSVTQNRTFAWAYEGMPYFKPYEISAPETSNAVMSALLFYDLNDAGSNANPKKSLSNPNQLFEHGGFHGGTWRCAYEVDSIGESSVLIYFSRVALPYLGAIGAVGLAVGAKFYGVF